MLHTYSRLHPPLYTGFELIFGTKATAVPQFSPSSPYFFIDLSGRKYSGWMFCQVYQCFKFPTSHRNQLTVSVCCSLLQPKLQARKTRVLQRWDVTIWSNPGSTAIISIILLSIYSSWSVSDITRNLPILFTSLFIDIILHYITESFFICRMRYSPPSSRLHRSSTTYHRSASSLRQTLFR